jgi:hypothetical protein
MRAHYNRSDASWQLLPTIFCVPFQGALWLVSATARLAEWVGTVLDGYGPRFLDVGLTGNSGVKQGLAQRLGKWVRELAETRPPHGSARGWRTLPAHVPLRLK